MAGDEGMTKSASPTAKRPDLAILAFESAGHFERWLAKNHQSCKGIWLRFFKKASGRKSIYYPEALDAALCHGWIDGQVKRYDELSYLQRFTPRRPKSLWSKRNREHVKRLTREGRMQPAGLAAVAAAKRDGRWKAAYDSPAKMDVPDDFLKALSRNGKAKAFFATLNRTHRYAIAWRLATARKPETRLRRMKAVLATLAEGRKLH